MTPSWCAGFPGKQIGSVVVVVVVTEVVVVLVVVVVEVCAHAVPTGIVNSTRPVRASFTFRMAASCCADARPLTV